MTGVTRDIAAMREASGRDYLPCDSEPHGEDAATQRAERGDARMNEVQATLRAFFEMLRIPVPENEITSLARFVAARVP